ncbi:hypothetical protein [Xylophilus sp.]|uniref:hypothetical protein n=1 Tax=Xylophilus sp. TaxID=2653893 RepID=UPI0013B81E61|nr:hypothetical protein [Xylophilus sp.]KAF1043891.1 MAG: hypothetical protein GAK38_03778 [Xylophilus sp.]
MTYEPPASPGTAALLVADAGPLIVLGLVGLLAPAAHRYGPLAVPDAAVRECLAQPGLPGEGAIREALDAGQLRVVATAVLEQLATRGLGAGEAAVIAFAQAHGLVALVDDRKARQTARRLGVPLIGSGAVPVQLKRSGHVTSVQAVLDRWHAHGYFVAEPVRQALLAAAGE